MPVNLIRFCCCCHERIGVHHAKYLLWGQQVFQPLAGLFSQVGKFLSPPAKTGVFMYINYYLN